MKNFETGVERFVYYGIAALLFWAPLPLASNRPFLQSLIVCWSLGMTVLWLCAWIAGIVRPKRSLRGNALSLALMAGWLLIVALQNVELPTNWLGTLSPASLRAYEDVAAMGGTPLFSISVERNESGQYFFLGIAYFCVMALTLAIIDDRRKLQGLCLAIVLSGTVQALLGIMLHFASAEYSLFFRKLSHASAVTGGFVNRNSLAAFLEIALGCGIGLMVAQFSDVPMRSVKQRVRWLVDLLLSPKLILRALLIVMVLALILTRSRMGNGAFFAATLLIGVLGLLLIRNSGKAITIFLASMIAFDIFVIGSWFGVEKVAERIEQTAMTVDERRKTGAAEESLEERGIPASAALQALRDYPVFGSGTGTFSFVYPSYRPALPVGTYEHAHNDYAEFALEGGLLGFAFLALLYLLALITALRAMARPGDQRRRGVAMGCVFALVSIGLHMFVDMPMQIPANALAMCVVIAMALLTGPSGSPHANGSNNLGGRDKRRASA